MRVVGIDERHLAREVNGGHFVVFIYAGRDDPQISWAVDSYLVTDADLPGVLRWLSEELPTDGDADLDAGTITCWSLGLVHHPARPTTESHLDISWIIGSDVLNRFPADRSVDEQRLADEMLARRHHVTLPW